MQLAENWKTEGINGQVDCEERKMNELNSEIEETVSDSGFNKVVKVQWRENLICQTRTLSGITF